MQAPSTIAHSQKNGLTESTNKNIKKAMKKKLEVNKGLWVKELPEILWALRTTPKSSTKETPFTLAFGHEDVISVEIDVNTLRVFGYDADDNDERLKADLNLLDEIKDEPQVRAIARRQQVAKYYNNKFKPKTFIVRDLVLRNFYASLPPTEYEKLLVLTQ